MPDSMICPVAEAIQVGLLEKTGLRHNQHKEVVNKHWTSVDYSNLILVSTMVTMVPMLRIIRWQLINIRCLVSLLQRYYLV